MGDATNFVLILAGELLKKAEHLIIMGLHPTEVTQGYELACKKALEELESALWSYFTFPTNDLTQHISLSSVIYIKFDDTAQI